MGLDMVMLTGDSARTAEAIAADLGISNLTPNVLPVEKAEKIKELRKIHGAIAMVGDVCIQRYDKISSGLLSIMLLRSRWQALGF